MKYMLKEGVTFDIHNKPDAILCFIESTRGAFGETPLIQRLDNIYFNTEQNYKAQNANIKRTYDGAAGVVFQSEYSQNLITRWFGHHPKSVVIHNGADIEYIGSARPFQHSRIDKYEKIWCCAASWRPHKRLEENVKYFLEHAGEDDCLIVAGAGFERIHKSDRILYVGELNIAQLTSLYKRADYFVHLAYLDCCPNVVVDARAAGCKIICASSGGSREVAGAEAVIIQEEEWNYEPIKLYSPPKLDFDKKVKNGYEMKYDMADVARFYMDFLESFYES
jgi:glycosyltransferase involved in cell wall biosynthesis